MGHAWTRTFSIERTREGAEGVALSLSSETAVWRADIGGFEVLSHDPRHVDLTRATRGLPALWHHQTREQIGRVEDIQIVGRKLRGRLRFGASQRAREIERDVEQGIVTDVSVGYQVDTLVPAGERDGLPVYRATAWTPLEVSLVSVPADPTVGINRSLEHNPMSDENLTRSERKAAREAEAEVAREHRSIDECSRQIRALGDHFECQRLAEDHVLMGSTVPAFQRALRTELESRLTPVPVGTQMPNTDRIEIVNSISDERLRSFPGSTRERKLEAAHMAGQWVRAHILKIPSAERWIRDYGRRAMGEGTFGAGGAIVPEEMSASIINLQETYGVARRLCRVMPMNSDTLLIPRRASGYSASFIGENSAISDSDASWDQVTLVARKLGILTRFSRELAEDAPIDLAAYLSEEIARAFAEKEDDCLFNGDGSATYGGMVGIRTQIIDGTHTAGAVDATSGHDIFSEYDADDLSNVMAALPAYALPRAKWVCSNAAKSLVFDSLAQAAGGNTIATMGDQPRGFYLGHEIVVAQKMPALTTAYNDVAVILFGDFTQAATMGDRRSIALRLDESRYLEYDQLALLGTERFDIVVHDLGDTTTAGPVVALIANT